MNPDVIASLITGLLLLVGLAGIVFPVLPGGGTIIVGLLVWAVVVGGPVGWTVFAVGGALCLAGMIATYVLTGRVLRREQIPNHSVLVGMLCGVVGMFLIPVVGLPIGFAAGLFLVEFLRVQDAGTALRTSWEAVKASARGILVEFGCACLAVVTFAVGMLVHF
ncbi:DUF456 domain-containing protein [Tessaracoccus sp. OS52]|uniref:DUF456 domain-containing protein n=1 Tax=Tessaracoccus sp. OS52 TaxID=2886691 RepID=UPI001D128911|nr:DUF456 domain-containing protein [Tessaracoccus sp. OS52]